MKKQMFMWCLLLLGSALASCSDDEGGNPGVSELEQEYFSIENAQYREGQFPAATSTATLQGVTINERALSGGMNFITIVSDVRYNRFFIGVQGVEGYWEYVPDTPANRAEGDGGSTTYVIPVAYSTTYSSDITMLISGEDESGDITEPYETEITYVESQSGDLNINLTFSNAKDVDLHLFMPSGEHIYYGERGGTVETADGQTVSYGLDHDSNAACGIDNLNNENIYIPAELIQAGTYTVVVDMYANCEPAIATSWSVVARYKGQEVQNELGSNPASGVYPVGAGEDDMTPVIRFTLNEGISPSAVNHQIKAETFRAFPASPQAQQKMEAVRLNRMWREQNK